MFLLYHRYTVHFQAKKGPTLQDVFIILHSWSVGKLADSCVTEKRVRVVPLGAKGFKQEICRKLNFILNIYIFSRF